MSSNMDTKIESSERAPNEAPAFFVHPKGLVESDDVGQSTRVWAFAHVLKGAKVGAHCNIGECSFVENGAVLGDHVTIKNGVQVWWGVTCEDYVFVGPNATFTNDHIPRSGGPSQRASQSGSGLTLAMARASARTRQSLRLSNLGRIALSAQAVW